MSCKCEKYAISRATWNVVLVEDVAYDTSYAGDEFAYPIYRVLDDERFAEYVERFGDPSDALLKVWEIEQSCTATHHYPTLSSDEEFGRSAYTSADATAKALAEWDAKQFRLHRAPILAGHEGFDDERGYVLRNDYRSDEERLEREYAREWTTQTGEVRPGLVEYEYQRRRAAEDKGAMYYPWVSRNAQLDPNGPAEYADGTRIESRYGQIQREHRLRLKAKRQKRDVIRLLRALGFDPQDERVAERVRELGYLETIRSLRRLAYDRGVAV
jgi:hypothetical protein